MKWTALNALGGLAWLAGLTIAKGANFPDGNIFFGDDHRMIFGVTFGLAGLALLLWTNFRSA